MSSSAATSLPSLQDPSRYPARTDLSLPYGPQPYFPPPPQPKAVDFKKYRVKIRPLPPQPAVCLTPVSADPLLDFDTAAAAERGVDAADTWTPANNEWLVMISLSFISLMVSLDATILVTVLPEIAHSLGGSSVDAFWAGTSYLLTSAVSQPVIASISESFGRQQQLIASLVLFTFGTALCAVAHDFGVLLTGRCIQGVGGGGIVTLAQVIFCDIVPLRQRPKYFSLVLASWSVGSIVGPVVGGCLAEKASWRWCFHINFPFCAVGLAVASLYVRLDDASDLTLEQKWRHIDWLGAALFVGSTTSLLIGTSWGGVQHRWLSGATLAPIASGLVGIAVFLSWQRLVWPRSLLPLSLFCTWSSLAAFYCALVNGFVLLAALYYVPLYLMAVRGFSPVRAGVGLFPAVCLLVPGSVVVAVLTSRLGRYRWAIWAGWAITTVACGLFLLFDQRTSWPVFSIALVVFGVGNGMVLTSVNVGIQAMSKPEDCAMAASMYGFMRSVGMPLGVALSGNLFQNAMARRLAAFGLPAAIARDSERYVLIVQAMADTDPAKTAILESYVEGFQSVFIAMMSASASALVASLLIRKFSMDKALPASHTVR